MTSSETQMLTEAQIDDFQNDGVVLLRNAVSQDWCERLTACAEAQLNAPSQWANNPAPGAEKDRLFTDRYLWQSNDTIRDYVFHSPCAQLAAQAMRSQSARFYFDHLLIKEPQTTSVTPWHQDIPYWPFLGKQICSIWLALTPATVASSAMEFVRGSHLDDVYYQAQVFGARDDHPNDDWTGRSQAAPVPDIEANRDAYDIVGWDVEPGDAVIFSAWTLHWARGNDSATQRRVAISTRWLGDDAIWHPHDGADPTVDPEQVNVRAGEAPTDERFFPKIWPA